MKVRTFFGIVFLFSIICVALPQYTYETDAEVGTDSNPFERELPVPFNHYEFSYETPPEETVEFYEYGGLKYWVETDSTGKLVAQLVNIGIVTEGQVVTVPEYISYKDTTCQVVSVGICFQPVKYAYYTNDQYIYHVGITSNLNSQPAPTKPTTSVGNKDADVHYSIVFKGYIKIQDYAFAEFDLFRSLADNGRCCLTRSGLTSVTFEKGVSSIGQWAFADTCLQNFTVPETVTSVGDYAFAGTTFMKSISWNSDADIPNHAFCSTLSEIKINGAPKSIGNSAFNLNEYLTTIIIPDSVTTIGEGAFEQCTALKSVTIGDGVIKIPKRCFRSCSNLTDVSITKSVKEIGGAAFNGSAIKSFDFSGIEAIGSYAFYGVFRGTDTIELDLSNIKTIGDCAFQGWAAPVKLTLSSKIESIGKSAFAFSGNIEGSDISIPANCIVESYAFAGSKISSVSLADGLTLGTGAFTNCSYLTNVSFGENCVLNSLTKSTDKGVFEKSGIEKLTIPASLTLGRNSFAYCEQLKEITFENGRTEITRSFEGCTNLAKIKFPDELISVSDYAFYGCTALNISDTILNTSVENVLKWGVNAFAGTASLKVYDLFEEDLEGSITFLKLTLNVNGVPRTHSFMVDIEGATNSMKLDAPYEYEYTMPDDFAGFTEGIMNKKMPKFVFPNNFYQTYDGAVYSSDGFTLLKVPYNQLNLAIPENVTTIAPDACYQTYLTLVKIPASVTEIGSSAFYCCTNLSAVELNEGLKRIGDYAFSLTCLKEVVLPSSVEYVGDTAFYGVDITVPYDSHLTHVGKQGLSIAEGGSVLIPSSISDIGDIPFGYKMSEVYLTANPSEYPENLLRSADRKVTIENVEVLAHPYDVAFYLPLGTDISDISFDQLLGCERGYFGGYYVNTSDGPLIVDDKIVTSSGTIVYFYTSLGQIAGTECVTDSDGAIITLSIGTWTVYDVVYSTDKGTVMALDSESPYVLRIKLSGEFDGTIVTISERLSEETVTITFEANGGTSCPSVTVGKGRTISESNYPTPTKNRSEFAGWFDIDGNEIKEYSPIDSDITLYAKWIEANPRIIFDDDSHMVVKVNGSEVSSGYRVSSEDKVSIEWTSTIDGYSFDHWSITSLGNTVTADSSTYALTNIVDDTEVVLYERYYNPSDNIRYINSVDFSEDTGALYLQWTTGFNQNTAGMKWTGGSGTPLVIDDRLYTRAGDKVYMYDLDTGRVLKTVQSVESGSFYHYLGYANGMIFDYMSSKVYDSDLEYVCDSPIAVSKLVSDDTGIYMFSGSSGIYKYSLDLKTMIWKFSDGYRSYSNWGSPGGIQIYDGYLYWVGLTKNKEITLQSVDLATGTDFHDIVYSEYKNYMLDDGWITCADGAIFISIYSTGLFGESVGLGGGILATAIDKGVFSEDYKYYELTEKSQSNFIVYNGRGYINSGYKFYVFDVDGANLTEVYSYQHQRYTHGGITLNIPPGSDSVEILFIPYDPISTIVMFYDEPGQTLPKYRYLGCEVVIQYNTQAVRFTDDGRIYFYNDFGNIFVLGDKIETTFLMIRENDRIRCITYDGTVEDAIKELNIPDTYYKYMLDGFNGSSQIDYDSTATDGYRIFYFADVPLTSTVWSEDLQWYSEEYGMMTINHIKLGNLYLDGAKFTLVDNDGYTYTVKYVDSDGKELKTAYTGKAALGSELDLTELTKDLIVGYTYVGPSVKGFKISINESENVLSLVYASLTPVVKDLKDSAVDGTATVTGLQTIADEGNSVELELPEGTITLDNGILKKLGTDDAVSVSLTKVVTENLSEELRRNVPAEATVYSITLMSADAYLTELGGTATITIATAVSGKNAALWHLADTGDLNRIDDAVFADGAVTFTTDHFSYYVIGTIAEDVADDNGSVLIICLGVAIVVLVIVGVLLMRRRSSDA